MEPLVSSVFGLWATLHKGFKARLDLSPAILGCLAEDIKYSQDLKV